MDWNHLPEKAKAVFANIVERRSCPYKRLKRDAIPQQTLMNLFEAANWAPTHRYTEPWRFSVFTGAARQRLADAVIAAYQRHCGSEASPAKAAKILDRCLHVPAILNVVMMPCEKNQLPEYEEVLAVGCAMQNLHLAAQALDISGLWSTPLYLEDPLLRQFLELEAGSKNFGFFYMGYIDGELPRSKRKPITEKVRWFEA